ncbi:hypothetical protein, partial [Myxococcus vastator]|uniref:hypothetical protein n=1 Tax=Myxococcus vastator TaxID=2709664 RepID=UPI001968373E
MFVSATAHTAADHIEELTIRVAELDVLFAQSMQAAVTVDDIATALQHNRRILEITEEVTQTYHRVTALLKTVSGPANTLT